MNIEQIKKRVWEHLPELSKIDTYELSQKTSLSVPTLFNYLNTLEHAGLVTRSKDNAGNSAGRLRTYWQKNAVPTQAPAPASQEAPLP
jgi:predicted transcriptional regulator